MEDKEDDYLEKIFSTEIDIINLEVLKLQRHLFKSNNKSKLILRCHLLEIFIKKITDEYYKELITSDKDKLFLENIKQVCETCVKENVISVINKQG